MPRLYWNNPKPTATQLPDTYNAQSKAVDARPNKPPSFTINPAGNGAVLHVNARELSNPFFKQAFREAGGKLYGGGPVSTYMVATDRRGFWENPQRVGRYYQALKALPPHASAPPWLQADKLKTAYDYFQAVNDGKPWWMWNRDINDDDPARDWLQSMTVPDEVQIVERNMPTALDTPQRTYHTQGRTPKSYEEIMATPGLPWWQYAAATAFMTGGGRVAQLGTQGVLAGLQFGAPGAFIGGGLGTIAGLSIEAEQKRMEEQGAAYKPSLQYKLTGGAFEALNWLYEGANKSAGFLAQLGSETAEEALANPQEAFEAGTYSFASVFEALKSGITQSYLDITGQETPRNNIIMRYTLGYADPEIIEIPGGMAASEYMLTEGRRMLMAGASPDEVEQWARDTFGFGLETSDLLAGFFLDPLDRIAPAVTGVTHGVARAVGNEPLAAATGRFYGTQAVKEYGRLIRNMPAAEAAKLDPVSRMIAGVDAEGNVKAYIPLDKAPKLWELDNRSRAAQAINTVADGLGVAFADEVDPNRLYKIVAQITKTPVETAANMADTQPIPTWFNGTEAQVIPMALRDQMPRLKEMLDNYNITRDQARVIQNIADAMGIEPERLMADYHNATAREADDLFKAFIKALDDRAAAGDKGAQNIRATLAGNLDGAGVQKMANLFFGSDGAPFRPEEFKYRAMVMLMDGADQWAANWYKVKPAGWFQRLSGVVKQAQGYLLLGFNPTYLLNNVIDNFVKLSFEGVMGFSTGRVRAKFLQDLGVTPIRLRTGMSAAEIGDVSMGRVYGGDTKGVEIGRAVRKAAEPEGGAIKAVSDFLKKGDKVQVFARWSAGMERLSSEIGMVTAMRQYWGKVWHAGSGFDRMTPDLRLALDAFEPGLAAKVERAISRGMSRKQIEAEVFNNWETPSIKDVLTPDEYSMLTAHFPDVMDALDADIRAATTPTEVQAAFNSARQKFQNKVGEEIRSNYEQTIETARQKAEVEGVAGVLDTVDDIQRGYGNFWLQHFERADAVAKAAAAANSVQASAMWLKFFEQEDKAFRQYRNIHGYKWLGTFKGLGADDPVMAKVLWLLGGSEVGDPKLVGLPADAENIYTIWTGFFDERRRLMVELSDLQKGKAQPEVAARIGEIDQSLNDLYVESVLAEDLAQTRIDDLFAELYEAQIGDQTARQWRLKSQAIRRKMAAAEIMWRQGALPDRVLEVFGKDVLPDKLVTAISKALLNKKKGSDPFHQEIYPSIIREWMDARNGTVLGEQPKPPEPTPQAPGQVEQVAQPAREIAATERANWIRQAMSDGGYKAPQHMWNSLRKYLPEGKYDALERVPLDELRAAFEKRQVEKAKAKIAKPVQETRTEGAETRREENALLRELIDQELKKAEALGMTMEEARRAIFTDERGSGALNLRAFERDMAGMAARGGKPVVGFLDLRGLGKTNKTHGDAVGDAYIRTVVQLAQENGLTIYRKGGDEFLVLGENEKALRASLDELSKALDDAVIEAGDKQYVGAKFHYGTGSDIASADAGALEAMRADPMAEQFASKQYALQEMGSDAIKQQAAQLETNAEAIAPPRFSGREAWAQELTQRFGQEQADAQMVVMDRFAELYAQRTGRPASEWYNQVLLEGGEGAPDASLEQVKYRVIPVSEVSKTKGATYRGGKGAGTYVYGKGLYSTTSRKVAAIYGDVVGIVGGMPDNPIRVPRYSSFEDILLRMSGMKSMREFNKAYPDPGKFVRSLGYDGVIDGDTVVKYDKGGLFQSAKGATYWTDHGQAIIKFFKGADISTGVHEVVHAYTPFMDGVDSTILGDWYKAETGKDAAPAWHTAPIANRDVSEYVARGFEKYLADGPTPEMRYPSGVERVFGKIKDWLVQIYRSITGSSIDLKVSDKVRALFDRWMGGQTVEQVMAERIQRTPVNQLPGAVQDAIRAQAQVMLDEVGAGFNPVVYLKDADGKIIGRQREGAPAWYTKLYESTQDNRLAVKVRAALKRIITGTETRSKTAAMFTDDATASLVKGAILDILTDEYQSANASVLWYLGRKDDAMRLFGSEIDALMNDPNTTAETLRQRFGDYADDITNEWMLRQDNEPDVYKRGEALYQTDGEQTPQQPPAAGMPVGTVDSINPMPTSEINYEGYLNTISPMLDKAEGGLLDRFGTSEPVSVQGLDKMLDANTMRKLRAYLGKAYAQLGDVKMGAIRYGEAKRDAAILNYSARTGWDNLAGTIFPYQFWYTHSALNWVLRAIDKPGIFSNWARIRMIQERYEREGYPSRLNGKMAIPAPFLPKWMGGSIYVDPMRKIFGFEDMLSPFATLAEQNNKERKRAAGIIYDWIDQETVNQSEAQEAIDTQSGPLWDRAIAQARNELEADIQNPWDFATTMVGTSLPIQWTYNALMGRKDKIGMLPISRLIQNATAVFGIGGPQGVNIEAPLRKALGMPQGGPYNEYYIERELSNMVADGLLEPQDAIQAMIDKQGEAYTMAQRRVANISGVKYLGAPLGADLFPEGEKEMRALQDEYSAAAEAGQLREFFEKYPEYEARLALFKEPEQRMRQFIIGNIWKWWNDAPKLERKQAQAQFGELFTDAFINKETRSYDSIDTQTLAWWARTVRARTPETAPATPDTPLEMPAPGVQGMVNDYYATIEKQFPDAYALQSMYYGLPEGAKRKAFLKANPQLKEYWDWRRDYLATNPDVIDYVVSDESRTNAYLTQIGGPRISEQERVAINPLLQKQLAVYWINGKSLSPGAERELRLILKQSGRDLSLEEYLEFLKEALTTN